MDLQMRLPSDTRLHFLPLRTGTDGADYIGHPALRLMPDEKRLYDQLFRQADEGGVGVVTGDVAVQFFEKTRLDSRVLGEVSDARSSRW